MEKRRHEGEPGESDKGTSRPIRQSIDGCRDWSPRHEHFRKTKPQHLAPGHPKNVTIPQETQQETPLRRTLYSLQVECFFRIKPQVQASWALSLGSSRLWTAG